MKTTVKCCVLAAALVTAGAAADTKPDTGTAVPPPAALPQRSAANLEKLAMPIALHPDPLIAIILPASVYPVEIVEAARFVKNPNNLPKLDSQNWDQNVKALARFPDLIQKMDADLSWTVELGQAFLAQPKELMDAIQGLRAKAQKAGTLRSSAQQTVAVSNVVVLQTNYVQGSTTPKVVYVTNTVVQIQPASSEIIYVPTYPTTVYYPPPGPPPVVTFAAGVAVGAIIANNCDWHYGGVVVWGGRPPPPPPGPIPPGPRPPPPGPRPPPPGPGPQPYTPVPHPPTPTPGPTPHPPGPGPSPQPPGPSPTPPGPKPPGPQPPAQFQSASAPGGGGPQKWQPNQSRMQAPSAPSSASSPQARGWPSTAPGSGQAPGGSGMGSGQTSPGGAGRSSGSFQRDSAFGGVNNGAAAGGFGQRGSFSRGGGGMGGGRR